MVEMNGCILKRAVKKPAIKVKSVQSATHTTRASTIRATSGMPVKSKTWPKTEPVLTPWCMMIVAAVMPIPIMRPMERSVPVSRMSPATPSARNMRGEACWRMFRMFWYVRSCVPFTTGVMAHRKMKTRRMTM